MISRKLPRRASTARRPPRAQRLHLVRRGFVWYAVCPACPGHWGVPPKSLPLGGQLPPAHTTAMAHVEQHRTELSTPQTPMEVSL